MTESTRGHMDEYEALRTIISENAGLLNRVLEKIRIYKNINGLGAKGSAPAKDGIKLDGAQKTGPTREAKKGGK